MTHDTQCPEQEAPAKTLSVMRYDRVQSILDSVPALKDFLGPKDQEIVKRNKEKYYYSRGVVIVTNALHNQGHDAHNAPRALVLQLAVDLLRDKKQATKVVEKPKPKAEPPAKAEPKQERKSVEPKPKAEPKKKEPAAKPTPKSKPVKTEPAVAAKTVVLPQQPPPTEPAPAPPSIPASAEQKSGCVYYPYGTALSLALMLYKALEIGDRMPGAEGRLDTASKMIDMLKPLASAGIPMPEDFNAALNHDKISSSKS